MSAGVESSDRQAHCLIVTGVACSRWTSSLTVSGHGKIFHLKQTCLTLLLIYFGAMLLYCTLKHYIVIIFIYYYYLFYLFILTLHWQTHLCTSITYLLFYPLLPKSIHSHVTIDLRIIYISSSITDNSPHSHPCTIISQKSMEIKNCNAKPCKSDCGGESVVSPIMIIRTKEGEGWKGWAAHMKLQ